MSKAVSKKGKYIESLFPTSLISHIVWTQGLIQNVRSNFLIQTSKMTQNQMKRMGYTRGIVVQYQYQGIGIVLELVKNHLYPIPDQYLSVTGNAAIRVKEITQKTYYQ